MEKFTEQELVTIEFCLNQQKHMHEAKLINPVMKYDIRKVHIEIVQEIETLVEKVRKM